jgi:hypothetical protein
MANDLWQCTLSDRNGMRKNHWKIMRSPWSGGLHVDFAPIITIQVLLNDASHEFGWRYTVFARAGFQALCFDKAQADK